MYFWTHAIGITFPFTTLSATHSNIWRYYCWGWTDGVCRNRPEWPTQIKSAKYLFPPD